MPLSVKQTLEDGATVVVDDADGVEFALKPGQWEEIARLSESEQRTRAEQFLIANRADPTGGRTELDEQTIETAQNASTGEAHQESEKVE